jgi:hypothetical protein
LAKKHKRLSELLKETESEKKKNEIKNKIGNLEERMRRAKSMAYNTINK